ncbi:Outer membrane protein assembly factor BamC precursor [Vibrio aerogenes CECT 7868]|uniref:Outer membrane protein assembly factor BamC n=1 Tax=Vibrio aerogenes CECT 7868 TaxID=1216006 RepID=A0A1M5W8B4_9VIBR|nr:outer membrane protein assembly factor BamC [Vibrio aerogenes]SHH83829.1 Outer membrane protein assembly factor BamC precursor [Vibrio aerogenes CECT 7868]
MKNWYQLVCCSLAVLTVSACSDSALDRQQAEGDFDYLNESALVPWKYPHGVKPQLNHEYDVPAGKLNGALGEHVDIRPPQEFLALIPGVTAERSQGNVIFWSAKSQIADQIWQIALQSLESKHAQITRKSDKLIDAKWVEWQSDDEESVIEAHYQLSRVSKARRFGVQISMPEIRSAGQGDISKYVQERYTMKMVNKIATLYDAQMRVTLGNAQQSQKSIPVSMGTDRSGLPVVIARSDYLALWNRISLVLSQSGFSVEDRNRSQGTIKVKYSPPDDDFWSALGVQPLPLNSGSYTILLGDLENRTSLNITSSDGKPVKEEVLQAFAPVLEALLK